MVLSSDVTVDAGKTGRVVFEASGVDLASDYLISYDISDLPDDDLCPGNAYVSDDNEITVYVANPTAISKNVSAGSGYALVMRTASIGIA